MRNRLFFSAAFLAAFVASTAAAQSTCEDRDPVSVAEIGARLVACGGSNVRPSVDQWVQSVSAAMYATPDQRTVFLSQAAPLFRQPACAQAWRSRSADAIAHACRAAYCSGSGCADGTDVPALVSIIEAALAHDYRLPRGATSRWIAASMLLPALAPSAGEGAVLELSYDGERPVARWARRAMSVESASDRASVLRALRSATQPVPVLLVGFAFAHVSMLATLVERGIAFRFVGAPPAEETGSTAGEGARAARGVALGDLEDESGSGMADPSVAAQALSTLLPGISDCVGDAAPSGRVVVGFTVETNGRLTSLSFDNRTRSPVASRCVERAIRSLHPLRPAPEDGSVHYAFPFVFTPPAR